MEPRERDWWERRVKSARQRLNGWRRRYIPDWLYALVVCWRVVRSPHFTLAIHAVGEVAQGGAAMREKRAWVGLKDRCAKDVDFTENTWRSICAEWALIDGLRSQGFTVPPAWRRQLLLELAYVTHREHH